MVDQATVEDFFADNYLEARQKFLSACEKKALEVETIVLEVSAQDKTELATDVARIGSAEANKLLVLTSGVHGAELMCGSGCQVGLLESEHFTTLPADTAVLMIHAINPWGAAKLRRNNEDNVDLCRNFVDFSEELPVNQAYQELHEALSCPELTGPGKEQAQDSLRAFRSKWGEQGFVGAIMSGQYQHPRGIGYGGSQATWSSRQLRRILEKHGKGARQVCLADFHSGLGNYGEGVVVCMHEGEALQRARLWFGEDLMAPMAEAGNEGRFHPAIGHTTAGYIESLPGRELTSIVIEYGTYDMETNLQALLDDHTLFLSEDDHSASAQNIKQRMLTSHFPDDPEWRYAVWTRSEQIIEQAMGGLHCD